LEQNAVISIGEAQTRLLSLAAPLPLVDTPLAECLAGYLARDVIALRRQPAADLSAMDGYAISSNDLIGPWQVIGESAAGHSFDGSVLTSQAVRIFTGAYLPKGTDTVIIQEDASAYSDTISLNNNAAIRKFANVRIAGSDFNLGDILLPSGACVTAGAIAVAAMGGHAALPVFRAPRVSFIATGDELSQPGLPMSRNQIPSSNTPMLAAMLRPYRCVVTDRGIAADTMESLMQHIDESRLDDIIVTIGGASVGDHDLVQSALKASGAAIDFWKVSIKPGKPIMLGKLGNSVVIGLPGNPSSAFVTAFLFLLPLILRMNGCSNPLHKSKDAILLSALPKSGARTEYIRGFHTDGNVTAFSRQDSGLTHPLSHANAIIIRDIEAAEASIGSRVKIYLLD
jgi:molybdopterin molybdotransferase